MRNDDQRYRHVSPNSALVTDACGRRFRAFFSAAQRERKDFPVTATAAVKMNEGRTASL